MQQAENGPEPTARGLSDWCCFSLAATSHIEPACQPQWTALSGAYPPISRFFGISIAMYFDDHGPPHFHARHAEGSAKVRIDTLEVIDSDMGGDAGRYVLCSPGRSCTRLS